MKKFFLYFVFSAQTVLPLRAQGITGDPDAIRDYFQTVTDVMYEALYAGDQAGAIEMALEITGFIERAVPVPRELVIAYIMPAAGYYLACVYSLSGKTDFGIDVLWRTAPE